MQDLLSRFWSWVLVVLWLVQTIFFSLPGLLNTKAWSPLLFALRDYESLLYPKLCLYGLL